MIRNVATDDRISRIIIAVVAVVLALSATGVTATVLWVGAALMLSTGTTGFCPVYRMLRMSTHRG